MALSLTREELDYYLHDNNSTIRRWVYNGLDMAAKSCSSLFRILIKCDDEALTKCLNDMGLRAVETSEGEINHYLIMLKRNIAFVKILRNRRIHYSDYMDHDRLFSNRNRDYHLSKMEEAIRENREYEAVILSELYNTEIFDDDDSVIILSNDPVPELIPILDSNLNEVD
jgi:hypothetical protein